MSDVPDLCEDSAQSAPANFTFETVLSEPSDADLGGDILSQAMNAVHGNPIDTEVCPNGMNDAQRFLNSFQFNRQNPDLLLSNEKETVQFDHSNDHLISGERFNCVGNLIPCTNSPSSGHLRKWASDVLPYCNVGLEPNPIG